MIRKIKFTRLLKQFLLINFVAKYIKEPFDVK